MAGYGVVDTTVGRVYHVCPDEKEHEPAAN